MGCACATRRHERREKKREGEASGVQATHERKERGGARGAVRAHTSTECAGWRGKARVLVLAGQGTRTKRGEREEI